MTTVFREPEPVTESVERPDPDNTRVEMDAEEFRPIEDEQDVLEALGIADDVKSIPPEDYQDLKELKSYLTSYMEEKGLPQTLHGMRKAIESLKEDVGLHKEADPQAVIKKIGGVARGWKELSFVRDLDERKAILVKLISASNPNEMDRIIFEEMEKRKVWQ